MTARALTSLDKAQAMLFALLAPVAPCRVALTRAAGLIAAETVFAPAPVPSSSIALRAGFALCARDVTGASAYAPVPLAQSPVAVRAGEALPPGCDCIVEASGIEMHGILAQAIVEAFPGENTRRTGEDFAAGSCIVTAGHRLQDIDLFALAATGAREIAVRQACISLNGEGSLADYLAEALRQNGARLAQADEPADLAISLGEGEADEWLVRGIALEPGREAGIARARGVASIVVPPLADHAFALVHALIQPALDILCARLPPVMIRLPLKAKLASRVGLAELALLAEEAGGFMPLAVGDLPLQSLVRATHVSLIAAGSEGHAAGELISARSLNRAS